MHRRLRHPQGREAERRAEELLLTMLTPEQAEDWKANKAFNVRGSAGNLWRINPKQNGSHAAMIRQDGHGTAVWPIGLEIKADIAIAMLLCLGDSESNVYRSGCHTTGFSDERPWYGSTRVTMPHDYSGKL